MFFLTAKVFRRPDEAAMFAVLEKNKYLLAETLIVLAWRMGLTREEIYNLKWEEFSFSERLLHLPDRAVPMDEEAFVRLNRRCEMRGRRSEYVAANDRNGKRVHINYIPACVRSALDEGGLQDITLVDLRQDFVIRQLQEHPWPYVARISGVTASTLFQRYADYLRPQQGNREGTPQEGDRLPALLQTCGASPEGLALRMSRYMGLGLREMVSLTWEQVDLESGILLLADGPHPMPEELNALLKQVRADRRPEDDPHVLLSVQARRPILPDRLSVMVRTALIRGGMEQTTLADLLRSYREENMDSAIMQLAETDGEITRSSVMSRLGLTGNQASKRLRALAERKKLVRVGAKYYLPGTVVAPEEQYEAIRAYLRDGGAYRDDLARLLRLEGRLCGRVLSRLVEEGKLVKTAQLYTLPETQNFTEKP